jgi:alpha-beta hydrolase superfamily lysophospholipase
VGVGSKKKNSSKKPFFSRHWRIKHFLVGLTIILALLVALLAGIVGWSNHQVAHRQNALQPFYDTSGLSLSGPIGQVVRSEPLGVQVQNGSALRVLYRTQKADGAITFASGMVFVPDNNNAGSPRPVVAWAHGTVGMGDQCAPSRIKNPTSNIAWVSDMLAKGWVVTATDYAGLGTAGTEGYLIGGDEARDVLNSVRALRYIPQANASNRFAVWGHSQGGHSALFTASQTTSYAPELRLVGTVASAPAAELPALLSETNGSAIDWVIGPEVATSWPKVYPNLNAQTSLTSTGYKNYRKIADQCIAPATLEGLTRTKLKQQFFKGDPISQQAWRNAAQDQTAPLLAPSQPLLVAESLTDKVVLPNTTALYIQRACQARSNLGSLWLTGVGHIQLSSVISPEVIIWIGNRFAGLPATPTCNQPLPITPATAPPS